MGFSEEEELALMGGKTNSIMNNIQNYKQRYIRSSGSSYNASKAQILPSVVAIGAVQQTQGQGPMTPTQQRYVGLAVQGDFQFGRFATATY